MSLITDPREADNGHDATLDVADVTKKILRLLPI